MNKNPLAEVFGYPVCNISDKAEHYRKNRLCPYSNIVPNCTKDKAESPLGVCSISHGDNQVITCPVRFREDWLIIENAAKFAFPEKSTWTSLSEIKLLDESGQSVGNIDYVIVRCDNDGKIIDFASVEVQGVYISGNLRNVFNEYMKKPSVNFQWSGKYFPHPDYLSSSRKRLIPQLLYKGGVFKSWQKKQCVAIQESFYETLPQMPEVDRKDADIAWFLYDLEWSSIDNQYHLVLKRTIYTDFSNAIQAVTTPNASHINDFIDRLQSKLDTRQSYIPETDKFINLINPDDATMFV